MLEQNDFIVPVLEALDELGGTARTQDVVDRVGLTLGDQLKDYHHEALPSNGETRWRNWAKWARKKLTEEAYLSRTSKRGVWELNHRGRQTLMDLRAGHLREREVIELVVGRLDPLMRNVLRHERGANDALVSWALRSAGDSESS